MDSQVTVNRNRRRFRSSGCRLSLSITTSLETPTAFPADRAPRCAPTEHPRDHRGKQVWCSLEYNIWRYIHSYHRGTVIRTLLPFAVTRARQFSSGSSRHHRSGRFHPAGSARYCKRRAHTVKVDRKLARLHINGIKLPSISTPVT